MRAPALQERSRVVVHAGYAVLVHVYAYSEGEEGRGHLFAGEATLRGRVAPAHEEEKERDMMMVAESAAAPSTPERDESITCGSL